MKNIILSGIVVLSLLICGCQKILDIKPKDFVSPSTYFNKEADAVAALNAAYDVLTRQFMYAGYYQSRMLVADDVWCILTGSYPGNLKIDASESRHIPRLWDDLYRAIEYCNILLENLPEVTGIEESERGVIRGEALFMRAFCYFRLVDSWGAVPLKLKPTAGPNDIHIARTPIEEVYAQILKDMTEAQSLVPTTASGLYGCAGYPAKTTIQGMLARVCLTMAGEPLKDVSKYEEARSWAQKVIESHAHSLNPDYKQIFINMAQGIYDKKEVLWEVDFNDVDGSTEHGYIGFLDGIRGGSSAFGNSVEQVQITRRLFNSYGGTPAEAEDLRRDWNCAPFYYTSNGANKAYYSETQIYGRGLGKFRIHLTHEPRRRGRSPINFPILRYSDVLLMWAEADNFVNQGPSALAYEYVDMVRARAYGKMLPGATDPDEADVPRIYAGNPQGFLTEVIAPERFREFAGEALRKHDLIRWGNFVSAIKAMGVDAGLPPAVNSSYKSRLQSIANLISSRDLLWPIPADELTYNKLMTQNPGW